jgi:ribosomal protein S18 acetylase RimI-like enzyme
MTPTTTVRPLTPDDAPACDAVILSLPYFFGDPVGRKDCAAAVRNEAGFVVAVDEAIAGFITLKSQFAGSVEITWLAVHAAHRRCGLGRMLIDAAVAHCIAERTQMLFVQTLGPSVPEDVPDNYEGTRTFYRTTGFIPLVEIQLREWNNTHTLILARPLGVVNIQAPDGAA